MSAGGSTPARSSHSPLLIWLCLIPVLTVIFAAGEAATTKKSVNEQAGDRRDPNLRPGQKPKITREEMDAYFKRQKEDEDRKQQKEDENRRLRDKEIEANLPSLPPINGEEFVAPKLSPEELDDVKRGLERASQRYLDKRREELDEKKRQFQELQEERRRRREAQERGEEPEDTDVPF